MIKQQKVTIIIPVYNAEKTLHNCLVSVTNQTYTNLEIILVNDGSTDNSLQICQQFAHEDKRIKVISQKNRGPSAARNKGINKATGKYIQFVDADDRVTEFMTEKLVSSGAGVTDFVLCGYFHVKDKKRKKIIPMVEGAFTRDEFFRKIGQLYADQLLPSPCNKLYRLDIIKQHHIQFQAHLNFGEDLLFNIDYLNKCNYMSVINEPLYIYYHYDDSLSKQINHNYLTDQLMLINKVRQFLLKQDTYKDNNKRALNTVFSQSVINLFSQLIQQYNGNKRNVKHAINKLFTNKTIRKNLHYFTGSRQARLLKTLIKFNLTGFTYLYLKTKHMMSNHAQPFYNFFKRFNIKEDWHDEQS